MCAAVALSALRRWATGYQPGTAKSDEALVRHEVSGGGGFPNHFCPAPVADHFVTT